MTVATEVLNDGIGGSAWLGNGLMSRASGPNPNCPIPPVSIAALVCDG